MFAYLISEVLCNIYQVCISTVRKAASPELPQRLDHERSLWKAFSKHRAGKLSARSLSKSTSKMSLISLHDWFTELHSNKHERKSFLENYRTD